MCRSYPALPVSCQLSGFPTTSQTKGQSTSYQPDIVKLYSSQSDTTSRIVRNYKERIAKADAVLYEVDNDVVVKLFGRTCMSRSCMRRSCA